LAELRESLLALPLDVALGRTELEGLRISVEPYGPPRAMGLTVEDPRSWRIAQVRESHGTVTLVVVPAGQVAVNLTTVTRGDAKRGKP